MATVSEKLAKKIAKNNGIYPGDPQCYAVFKYYNQMFNKTCFALAYDEGDLARYSHFDKEFLWRKNEPRDQSGVEE